MTDILIKSFNRPFYLDRCLQSISRNISGHYRITVLDDGTPQHYLDKIIEKHPHITILKSAHHTDKQNAITENLRSGAQINGYSIPTNLWIDAAKNASEYFIMTEDDVWFTRPLLLDELLEDCKTHRISLLKLGWLGNEKDDQHLEITSINPRINAARPKHIFLAPPLLMNAYFHNRFKMFSILYKLGLADHESRRKYWALNSILMGMYRKDYWLSIWNDMNGQVDEKKQLINAAVYYRKHRHNPNFATRLTTEAMKTTFQSSATGSYHEYGNSLDVNRMNFILNEAWQQNKLDAMENYPQDFSESYIQSFLDEAGHPDAQSGEWKKWATKFREQYRNIGAKTD